MPRKFAVNEHNDHNTIIMPVEELTVNGIFSTGWTRHNSKNQTKRIKNDGKYERSSIRPDY
jgi:hypothetical protein